LESRRTKNIELKKPNQHVSMEVHDIEKASILVNEDLKSIEENFLKKLIFKFLFLYFQIILKFHYSEAIISEILCLFQKDKSSKNYFFEFLLAKINMKKANTEEALFHLHMSIELNKKKFLNNLLLAKFWLLDSEYFKALNVLKILEKKYYYKHKINLLKGKIYFKDNKFLKAEEFLNRAKDQMIFLSLPAVSKNTEAYSYSKQMRDKALYKLKSLISDCTNNTFNLVHGGKDKDPSKQFKCDNDNNHQQGSKSKEKLNNSSKSKGNSNAFMQYFCVFSAFQVEKTENEVITLEINHMNDFPMITENQAANIDDNNNYNKSKNNKNNDNKKSEKNVKVIEEKFFVDKNFDYLNHNFNLIEKLFSNKDFSEFYTCENKIIIGGKLNSSSDIKKKKKYSC